MKKTNLLIISISLVSLISVSSLFAASNIGRKVYGVYSETYIGVTVDASYDDAVDYYPSSGADSGYSDCVEGKVGIKIAPGTWYTEPFKKDYNDMSAYSRIYFSVKFPSSGDTSKAFIKIKDTSAERPIAFNSTNIKCVDASSSNGILKDDVWHMYYIDLSDFSSLILGQVKIPLILSGNSGSGTFYVDNVIYAKSGAVYGNGTPVLDATLKKINGNGNASPSDTFTWNENSFRNGWKTADQYVEFNINYVNNNNNVDIISVTSLEAMKTLSYRIYTSSQTETADVFTTQDGLIPYKKNGTKLEVYQNLDPSKKLSMCWRMMDTVLSTTSGSAHTNIIGEKSNYDLYDLGSSDPNKENWNCWLYLKNISNENNASIKEYCTIWNYKGWHAASDSAAFYNGWACEPKLYIGAKFDEALAGLEYRNKINIKVYYQ